jgi:hypothetical protein
MPTEICITIDTEFSVGGAFADPRRQPIGEQNVLCVAGGEENGLGFLLDCFARHGIEATFFVEALQSVYFGDLPMGRQVERILRAGQDVQLHLHPCWLTFRRPDWSDAVAADPPNDCCDGRRPAEMQAIIAEGLAALKRIGAPAPAAMRTGNLRADRNVYLAMADSGLHIASNIGIGVFAPVDPSLHLTGGRHWIGDVLEVPVLTYAQFAMGNWRIPRLLAITAASWAETECLLWDARTNGIETVVVLTHPFEFIKGDKLAPASLRPNRINKRRLERLCAFVAAHPREFVATSFGKAAPRWLKRPSARGPDLVASPLPVLRRLAENVANNLLPVL